MLLSIPVQFIFPQNSSHPVSKTQLSVIDRQSEVFGNINSNYGRFNSCFLCPRSFEGISFVGQRLVDQLVVDVNITDSLSALIGIDCEIPS